MNKTKFVVAVAALCGAISFTAEAKLYKWVDADGVTQYGEIIPPEYANRDTKVLDKGRVSDRSETFDDKKKTSTKKETAEDRAAMEAKRKDEALLNSFTTEKEIDLSRDRALLQIEARINSFTTLIKSAQSSLDDLHNESEKRTSKGLQIPQSLTDDLANAEDRLQKLQKDLLTNQKEFDAVTARYAEEKKRFRELKGKEPLSK
jgi:hypothetical protein